MFFDVFVFVLIVHLHVCLFICLFFHLVIMRLITRLLEVGWMIFWSGESQCGQFACVYVMKIVQM
jgi:hypothetical protein